MNTVRIPAYAKVNLTLDVLSKRPDGYHALDTIMQTVSLQDTVVIERAPEVTVTVTGTFLPYQNTLRKAAMGFCAYTGYGAAIRVTKRIPAQAGLGGGSADAAAVLRGMQQLYDDPLDRTTLFDIALSVGADVPFCLHGGLCRCEGIGELLTPLAGPSMWFVIVKPKAGVSTKALFTGLTLPTPHPETVSAMGALTKGALTDLGPLLKNALALPAATLVPEIAVIRERLLDAGALGAEMSGSGSAVFGLFETEQQALAAESRFTDYPFHTVCSSI